MKINKKALELINKGLSAKTVGNLTESQIEILHSRLMGEATDTISKQRTYSSSEVQTMKTKGQSIPGGKAVKVNPDGSISVTTEGELDEEDDFDLDSDQSYTGQQGSHDEYQASDDGMDDDTSPENNNRKMVGMSEEKTKPNAYAICHSQVGPKKTRKFQRCVKSVEKQLEEGKNPVSLFIESQIIKIVEKHLPPRITKGDLLRHLSETSHKKMKKDTVEASEPTIAPSKPITKPDTKPRTRPSHPGKNPFPGEKEAPRAGKVSPDDAKDKVIDVILNLLKK